MTRAYALILLALIGLGAAGDIEAQDPDSLPPGVTPGMVELGSAIFHGRGMCVNCHGADATGMLGPDLTDGQWIHSRGSYLAILQVILSGVPAEKTETGVEMPPRGGLTIDDRDVQAVAGYVWALSHPTARDSLPHGVTRELIRRGEVVFQSEGSCSRCHGANARGDLGPDLTDGQWLHAKGSYLAIISQIMSGVPEERSSRGISMPPRGGSGITDAEVHAVAAYVWRISHQPREQDSGGS